MSELDDVTRSLYRIVDRLETQAKLTQRLNTMETVLKLVLTARDLKTAKRQVEVFLLSDRVEGKIKIYDVDKVETYIERVMQLKGWGLQAMALGSRFKSSHPGNCQCGDCARFKDLEDQLAAIIRLLREAEPKLTTT